MEEPPTKVTKFEMESQYLEGEVMEEGQEEWLSEGLLTDDDYNPAKACDPLMTRSCSFMNIDETDKENNSSQQTEADQSDSNVNTSQDETMASMEDQSQDGQEYGQEVHDNQGGQNISQYDQEGQYISQEGQDLSHDGRSNMEQTETNIEDALNSFEKAGNNNQEDNDLPDELNAFLIRKKDGKVVGLEASAKSKQSDDDGNDTDDLLRVLGDGDQKAKKGQEKANLQRDGDSTDDDDAYIFEGSKTKQQLAKAKQVLMRSVPKKAEPEDDDITDCSSDEAITVEKMFSVSKAGTKPTTTVQTASKVTTEPYKVKQVVVKVEDMRKDRVQGSVVKNSAPQQVQKQQTPLKQYVNKQLQIASSQKSSNSTTSCNTSTNGGKIVTKKREEEEMEEYMHSEKINSKPNQRLMRPEQMDEDIFSDQDSEDDDDSLYDELPSSDSDNVEDWFTLDIRAERAGDYIPLLGDRAHELLTEEKRRVQIRLDELKQNMAALSKSTKEQSEKLREATTTVAELDTMLSAA